MSAIVCQACGTRGESVRRAKGSFAAELGLWILGFVLWALVSVVFMLLPILYTVWRMTTNRRVCRACGSAEIIPADSPNAMASRPR